MINESEQFGIYDDDVFINGDPQRTFTVPPTPSPSPDLDSLSTSTNDMGDDDLIVSKEDGGSAWVKKTAVRLWNYIKTKLGISAQGSTGKYLDEQGNFTTPPNTTYSFSDNDPTLSWGTRSKVGTVGGTDLHVTMPANPDTNTWRPVQNNLTSDSTSDCLSAYQGKVLNTTLSNVFKNSVCCFKSISIPANSTKDIAFTMPSNAKILLIGRQYYSHDYWEGWYGANAVMIPYFIYTATNQYAIIGAPNRDWDAWQILSGIRVRNNTSSAFDFRLNAICW